jgi:hypothetical protein
MTTTDTPGIPILLTPSQTSTFTYTPSLTPVLSTGGPTASWSVAPNVSQGGQPIQWKVTLTTPSPIILSLYDIAGELVYQITYPGQIGLNIISWNLNNQEGQKVASGIYIFWIDISQGFPLKAPYGKVLVLR